MAKAVKRTLKPGASLLDDLEPLTQFDSSDSRSAAYKTVDTFAGITQRKLWLKHEDEGVARTDGHSIIVDLDQHDSYRVVEHELSHILFKSDSVAKVKFVSEYTARVLKIAQGSGLALDAESVGPLLDFTLNLIEDHRVDVLWGMLYPGSAVLQKRRHRNVMQTYVSQCHDSFLVYMMCLESGCDIPPGSLDVYRPLFETALKQVEYKGFLASLITAKWLVTQLVSEIINQVRHPGASGRLTLAPSLSYPTTPQERVAGLVELLKRCSVPDEVREEKDDVKPPAFKDRGADVRAKQMVDMVLDSDLIDPEKLDAALEETRREMEGILERAREAIRVVPNRDDWIRKDAMSKVVFHDIDSEAVKTGAAPLAFEDQETVRRLRAVFMRILGRRRYALDDSGVEVDVEALIERRVTKMPVPSFRQEERGRGFRTLILLDRSSSMEGSRTRQAERACRIVARALKFPFVQTDVWGFQSLEPGQVDIARFDRALEAYTSAQSKVTGGTPLHIAIRLAARYLEQGDEAKQLIVLTDGDPHYIPKGANYGVPLGQLQLWVRDEVHKARRRGINVTCLMIGTLVPREKLRRMFGPPTNWKTIGEERLSSDLINLVSSSFVKYLKSR